MLVLPTFNESGTIAEVVERSLASTPDVDLLVVDDNSPDGTGEIADRIAAGERRVRVLHRPGKGGLGPAYLAGFREGLAAGYDAMVEMDSDLSHDPADVARLVVGAAGADVVIGSRYVPGGATANWSRSRRALSRAGTAYARLLLGLPLTDATSGFRCYRRAVLETIPLEEIHSEGYAFQIEMAWRAWILGFKIAEIPIVFVERREGASKMSRRIVAEALSKVARWSVEMKRPPKQPHPRSVAVSSRASD
ncbi:MAG: polyprenol monophosphomannose synthase [Actinobacteria bacterium]|nr:MAG: polyprenol monophosphomannose synthase [Actinomycetota bacterium]